MSDELWSSTAWQYGRVGGKRVAIGERHFVGPLNAVKGGPVVRRTVVFEDDVGFRAHLAAFEVDFYVSSAGAIAKAPA